MTIALSCLIEELLTRQRRDHERGRYSLVKYHFAHYSFNAAGFTSGAAWETCLSPDLSEAYRFRVYLIPCHPLQSPAFVRKQCTRTAQREEALWLTTASSQFSEITLKSI